MTSSPHAPTPASTHAHAHGPIPASTPASSLIPAPAPNPADPPLPPHLLSDVRIVLVAPKHEANIGAVARCAANFECLSLVVVSPRCSPDAGEARKVACGGAVLDRLRVVSSLGEALADTASSIGFTRRSGATRLTHASLGHLLADFPWALPLEPPPMPAAVQMAAEVAAAGGGGGGANGASWAAAAAPAEPPAAAAAASGAVESGLTEAELRMCSYACAIPTGRVQPSMNLSHAVAVVLCELFSRRTGLLHVASAADVDRADALLAQRANGGSGAQGQQGQQGQQGLPPDALAPGAAGDGWRGGQPGVSSSGSDGSSTGNGNGGSVLAAGGPGHAGAGAVGMRHSAEATAEPSERRAAAAPLASTPSASQPLPSSPPSVAAEGTAPAAAAPSAAGGGAAAGGVEAGLLPASVREVDLLVQKVAAVAEAVGMRGAEGTGGGNGGNHGRKRLPVGHVRSVVSRARLNAAESRSLHGLASAVLQALDPDNPLEARKARNKLQHQQQRQQRQQGKEQQEQQQEQQEQEQQKQEQEQH
ncbi:hypothetical protein TSOC_001074 [Tetrabaena socialis]|uniref:tRNA/rRNA methyltransferase SpoU type domain-containing protein n=1 Tax=Tetrabaena socialis TaxID=47790 RepID=A0A2J8AHR7_9CHLO|nr:hypothetical protein TSOC_001074 [Tetrabaena socialis]|eukprot:PNH12047.1 hypothetical protein TSOC_001074 [Tetrabaena socialis]